MTEGVFRTGLEVAKNDFSIDHPLIISLIGSCFSENMVSRFQNAGFCVQANPMGIQYNPISLFKTLELVKKNSALPDSSFEWMDDHWINWLAHHDPIYKTSEDLKDELEANIHQWNQSIQDGVLVVTFGTAWVYELNETNEIVANCHKAPSNRFTKRLLSVEEIVEQGKAVLSDYSIKQIVFTISPVRHLRDGFIENQQSKATLVLAVKQLVKELSNTTYFPAYELVMDDLRGYQFFKSDLIHPNDLAIDYIWQKFKKSYFSESTIKLVSRSEKVMQAVQHRPFDAEGKAYRKHLEKTKEKLIQLQDEGVHVESALDEITLRLYPSNR